MKSRVVDGDSHFMEPWDLFERYIDPAYRDRAMHLEKDPGTDEQTLIVDGKPSRILNSTGILETVTGYGQKEEGMGLGTFDPTVSFRPEWQDMDKRVQFLDAEEIGLQVIFPTLGLLWEGDILEDAGLADAHCRAYNTWAIEMCAGHKDRLFPAAHISLRDPGLTVREIERTAKLGCRSLFLGTIPFGGKSFGHPDYDPIWATAQDLNVSVCIHQVVNPYYVGNQWYADRDPGFMWVTINHIQDQRIALASMVYDGVFDRFPKLRVGTVEATMQWAAEWLERFEFRYPYMGHTTQMKRSPKEYFAENIWIQGDPEEKMFAMVAEFCGVDRFFIGSDYPHAEGFVHPVRTARKFLSALPNDAVEKIMCENARKFFGLPG